MLDTLDMGAPISRTQNPSRPCFGSYELFHVERRVGSAVALASGLLRAAPLCCSSAKAGSLFNGGDCSRRLNPSIAKIRWRAYLALILIKGMLLEPSQESYRKEVFYFWALLGRMWSVSRFATQRRGTLAAFAEPKCEDFAMHGIHPSNKRKASSGAPTWWSSEWTFGLIALMALSGLAIVAALFAPEVIIL
jgi:hypothetical protein